VTDGKRNGLPWRLRFARTWWRLRCWFPWQWAHHGPVKRYEQGKPGGSNVVPVVPGATPIGRDLWARCDWCGTRWVTNALGEWVRL
jgi:hypothetical protein